MAKIFVNDLIKGATGKICSHSDIYYSMNKSSYTVHTGKLCHPYEGAASTAQLAAQQSFKTKCQYARTWLNANKPSNTNPNGTSDYQLAQKLKKQLQLSNVRQVVFKYMDSNGTVTLPSDDSSSSSTTYTLVLTASPSGAGTLTGGGSVAAGGLVTIKAVPATGYTFVKWSDNNTSAERVITVNSDLTLTAIFSGSGPEE